MYKSDYYPEYEEQMNFNSELNELKQFYTEKIKESSENVSEGFSLLVEQMEFFLRDYREHTKSVDSYNRLMEKISNQDRCELNSFIDEMKSIIGDLDD